MLGEKYTTFEKIFCQMYFGEILVPSHVKAGQRFIVCAVQKYQNPSMLQVKFTDTVLEENENVSYFLGVNDVFAVSKKTNSNHFPSVSS